MNKFYKNSGDSRGTFISIENMEETSSTNSNQTIWRFMGQNVPNAEIVYFCQIIIVITILIASLVNITMQNGNNELWISLLSGCTGYILPNPSIRKT